MVVVQFYVQSAQNLTMTNIYSVVVNFQTLFLVHHFILFIFVLPLFNAYKFSSTHPCYSFWPSTCDKIKNIIINILFINKSNALF